MYENFIYLIFYFDHRISHSSHNISQNQLPNLQIHLVYIFIILQAKFVMPMYSCMWGYPLEYSRLTRCHALKESWLSPPHQPTTAPQLTGCFCSSSSSARMVTDLILYRSCADNHSCCQFFLVQCSCHFQKRLFQLPDNCSYNLSVLSFSIVPDTWSRESDKDVPFMSDDLKDTNSAFWWVVNICFDSLLIHKEHFWGGLDTELRVEFTANI